MRVKKASEISLAVSLMAILGALLFLGCSRQFSLTPGSPVAATPTPSNTPTNTPTGTITPPAPTPTFTNTPVAPTPTPGYPQKPWVMFDGLMHFTFQQFQEWGNVGDGTMKVTPNFSDPSQQWFNPATGLMENSLSINVQSYGSQNWLNIDMTTPTGGAGGAPMDFSAGGYTQICFQVMATNTAVSYPMWIEINILNPGFDKCNKFINVTNAWQKICEPVCFQNQVTQMIFINFNNMTQKPPFTLYLAHIVAQ